MRRTQIAPVAPAVVPLTGVWRSGVYGSGVCRAPDLVWTPWT